MHRGRGQHGDQARHQTSGNHGCAFRETGREPEGVVGNVATRQREKFNGEKFNGSGLWNGAGDFSTMVDGIGLSDSRSFCEFGLTRFFDFGVIPRSRGVVVGGLVARPGPSFGDPCLTSGVSPPANSPTTTTPNNHPGHGAATHASGDRAPRGLSVLSISDTCRACVARWRPRLDHKERAMVQAMPTPGYFARKKSLIRLLAVGLTGTGVWLGSVVTSVSADDRVVAPATAVSPGTELQAGKGAYLAGRYAEAVARLEAARARRGVAPRHSAIGADDVPHPRPGQAGLARRSDVSSGPKSVLRGQSPEAPAQSTTKSETTPSLANLSPRERKARAAKLLESARADLAEGLLVEARMKAQQAAQLKPLWRRGRPTRAGAGRSGPRDSGQERRRHRTRPATAAEQRVAPAVAKRDADLRDRAVAVSAEQAGPAASPAAPPNAKQARALVARARRAWKPAIWTSLVNSPKRPNNSTPCTARSTTVPNS